VNLTKDYGGAAAAQVAFGCCRGCGSLYQSRDCLRVTVKRKMWRLKSGWRQPERKL